jgi:DNA invertase Pin-like site-specific DNA recombinase
MKSNIKETKKAATLARTCTNDGNSIDTQIAECQKLAAEQGYAVVHEHRILGSGMELNHSPEMRELRTLMQTHSINAILIFDRDRLHSVEIERLMFLAECKDNGVKIICVHGAPMDINTPASIFIENAITIGKKEQVLRHRAATKAGIPDAKRRKESSK